MKTKYILNEYFTLAEAYSMISDGGWNPYASSPNWYDMLHDDYPYAPVWADTDDHLKKYISDLMQGIMNRYYKHYVGNEDDAKNIWIQIFNIISFTYDKYATILDIYKGNLSKLMDAIKTTSASGTRFNDTPQDEGDFGDDEHASTFTAFNGESTTEGSTKIARIREIQDSIDVVFKNWLNEFDRLFIEEGNV